MNLYDLGNEPMTFVALGV